VLSLVHKPDEILVLDQTEKHNKTTESKLSAMHNTGEIIWRRLSTPSIPQAMNIALIQSDCDIVLFLDDDVEITSEVAKEHIGGHNISNATVVVGKIKQPWQDEELENLHGTHNFCFTSDIPKFIDCAMAGNMSVNREKAIEIGGFDENFVRVAYRFEDEFAQRVTSKGGEIYYHPAASIRHLKVNEGGTRSFGNHLTTIKPYHSVGAYYYFLRAPGVKHRLWNVIKRLINAGVTRHHFKKPWWIPVTVISELSGLVWAMRLYMNGPRYIR
jgi:GT2 family glycosyltransferase